MIRIEILTKLTDSSENNVYNYLFGELLTKFKRARSECRYNVQQGRIEGEVAVTHDDAASPGVGQARQDIPQLGRHI